MAEIQELTFFVTDEIQIVHTVLKFQFKRIIGLSVDSFRA